MKPPPSHSILLFCCWITVFSFSATITSSLVMTSSASTSCPRLQKYSVYFITTWTCESILRPIISIWQGDLFWNPSFNNTITNIPAKGDQQMMCTCEEKRDVTFTHHAPCLFAHNYTKNSYIAIMCWVEYSKCHYYVIAKGLVIYTMCYIDQSITLLSFHLSVVELQLIWSLNHSET